MKHKELEYDDYDTLVEWWKFWRFTPPIREILPNNGTGGVMILDDDNTPLCAGFVYDTNSYICWIEYLVVNPKLDKVKREDAIYKTLEVLKYLCKEKKYLFAFSSIKHESLLKKYINSGFTLGTKNTNEVIINLWE